MVKYNVSTILTRIVTLFCIFVYISNEINDNPYGFYKTYFANSVPCLHFLYTTVVNSGAGTAYPSGAPEITPGFWWGLCYSILRVMCIAL